MSYIIEHNLLYSINRLLHYRIPPTLQFHLRYLVYRCKKQSRCSIFIVVKATNLMYIDVYNILLDAWAAQVQSCIGQSIALLCNVFAARQRHRFFIRIFPHPHFYFSFSPTRSEPVCFMIQCRGREWRGAFKHTLSCLLCVHSTCRCISGLLPNVSTTPQM